MSREAYQVPSLGAQNTFGPDGLAGAAAEGPVASYVCGECSSKVSLKRGDQIRCKDCGHRVLYKERTKRFVCIILCAMRLVVFHTMDEWLTCVFRMVQFEAR